MIANGTGMNAGPAGLSSMFVFDPRGFALLVAGVRSV